MFINYYFMSLLLTDMSDITLFFFSLYYSFMHITGKFAFPKGKN